MRAIDAAQLIVNRLSRTGKSIDRSDLTKMLYLLDLTVLKHTGKRLVDEEFSFNDRGPFIDIKRLDDGNYQLEWDSYDTFDGFDPEKVVMPAEFIHDFDNYCEQLKDKIEANNEIEKVKFAEYQAKQKLEALEAKQKEIEKMEAKLQADKAKIDKLRKNLSNSGIEL